MVGYDVEQQRDTTEFSIAPEAVPYPLPVTIPLVLLGLWIVAMSKLFGLLFGVACYRGLRCFMRTKTFMQYRAPVISVSPKGIDVTGNSISRDVIHRVIQNHILRRFEGITLIAGAPPGEWADQANNRPG